MQRYLTTPKFQRNLLLAAVVIISACSKVTPAVTTLVSSLTANGLPAVNFVVGAQVVGEHSAPTVPVSVFLSGPSTQAIVLSVTETGTATSGTHYTLASTNLTIPPGATSGQFNVSVINTNSNSGSRSLVLTLVTATNAIIGGASSTTLTIFGDNLSSFSISGITGGADVLSDANLNFGTTPTLAWSTSSGAATYDVTIYASDGSTLVCGTQNSAATSLTLSGCSLTVGQTYVASVIAKTVAATNFLPASNSQFSFLVNASPNLGTIGQVLLTESISAGNPQGIDPIALGPASCGLAGCTLSISSVEVPTAAAHGTVTTNASTITYTPNVGYVGTDSFSYTIIDNGGGSTTGILSVRVDSPYTWTGNGGSAVWSNTANWLGGVVPGSSDTAFFNDLCATNCNANITSSISIKGLVLQANFTGTLTQGSSVSLTMLPGGFTQAGGSFVGSTGAISVSGPFAFTGGNFKSTSGTLNVNYPSGAASISGGTFVHNSGSVTFSVNSLSLGTTTFNNLSLSSSFGTVNLNGSMPAVTGNLSINCNSCTLNNGTLFTSGDVSSNYATTRGSAIIDLVGGGNQTVGGTGGGIPNLSIHAGGNVNLSTVVIAGNYLYSSGSLSPSPQSVSFGVAGATNPSPTIQPGASFYQNVTFGIGSQSPSLTQPMAVNNLTLVTSAGGRLDGNVINVYGDATGTSTYSRGTAVIALNGSGSQNISGTFPNLTLKGTGTVNFAQTVVVAGDYTYVSGTINQATNGLTFGLNTISPTNTNPMIDAGTVQYGPVNFVSGNQNFSLAQALSVNYGDLTVSLSGTSKILSNTIYAYQNVTVGMGVISPAALQMLGSSNATLIQSGVSNFTTIAVNKTSGVTLGSAISMPSGSNIGVTYGQINMAGYNLSVPSLILSSGTSVHLQSGVLTVGGSTIPTGPYGSGNIYNP